MCKMAYRFVDQAWGVSLGGVLAVSLGASFALFEPVAVAVHLEDVDVVGEPVEEGAGQAL